MIQVPDIPEADEEPAIARNASCAARLTGLSGLSWFMPDETCLLAPHRSALRLPEPGIVKNPPRADFAEALEAVLLMERPVRCTSFVSVLPGREGRCA